MLLVKSTHTKHLHKIFIKNSKDTQHLLISHYTCNGVNDITRLQFFIKQNDISQLLSMETKFFKRSYFTVLRVTSFKAIKILMLLPLTFC